MHIVWNNHSYVSDRINNNKFEADSVRRRKTRYLYTTDDKNCNIASGSSQWGYKDSILVNTVLQDQPKRKEGKTHEVIGTRHLHDLERAPDLPNGRPFLVQPFHGPRGAGHFPERVLAPDDDDLAARQRPPDVFIQQHAARLLKREAERHAMEQCL